MRERSSRQASSIIERAVDGADASGSCRSARWGKSAPDGGSRQRRRRSRASALAAVGVPSRRPSCRILHRRSSAAGCWSRSPRSSFVGAPRGGRRARPRPTPRRPPRPARRRRDVDAERRLRALACRRPSAATGGRLCRSGRSGALLRQREVRRRARALGRPRPAPPQRPHGLGAHFVPRLAARAAARRRALARSRPLRRALGARPARRAGRARLARGPLHGVRHAGRRRPVHDASRAPGGPRAAACRRGSRSRRNGASPIGSSSSERWRERSLAAAKD